MSELPRTIAVDLTPVLPGGENGGAKVFVLELLQRLAELAPETEFILLTQVASHKELAVMDRPNMRRHMVIGPRENNLPSHFLKRIARLLPHLPPRVALLVRRIRHSLRSSLRRQSSPALLRSMHADLLFCPFTAPTYFEPGIPTVCTVYDLQYKTYPEFFAAAELAHREHIFIEACRRATVLTAISDYSRQCAITHGDINPERIRTIHLRMARRVVPEAVHDKAALVRLGLTQQRYLLYPANFWKHKNHEMLLTAFGMACRGQLPADIKLVCTGAPGARQDWLLRAARAMGIAERVPFLGYLPEEELGPLIANSVGLFFPSLYEGFGLPVIEGMAAGVPVACSNTTSLVEVAADAAILFDPRVPAQLAEAMSKLVEDEALRARLVHAGRQRAEEFSDSRRMAREYWDVFLYALNRENHEDSLTGVYDDGWVGPVMHVHVSSRATPQSLDFDLFAPDWLPQRRLKIQAWRGGKRRGASLEVQRGANAHWSLPLTDTGSYEIRISPTFVPAQSGNSDDQRELSAKLRRCALKHADGQTIELFSESGRA